MTARVFIDDSDGGQYVEVPDALSAHLDHLEARAHAAELALLKIQREQAWTPCAQRMPESNADVLGLVQPADPGLPPDYAIVAYDFNAWRSDTGRRDDITHWRPLTPPPRVPA